MERGGLGVAHSDHARDFAPCFFAAGIIEPSQYGSLIGLQQRPQAIDDNVEEAMGMPRAAGTESIISAPVHELAANGTDGIAGQVRSQGRKHAQYQTAAAIEAALLWEDCAPSQKQLLIGF
jgi:hypothetical protein